MFVTTPPADQARLETMLGYALAAASMGYEVLIFFTLDGALVIKKQIFEKLDKKIKDRVNELMKMGAKFTVCSSACRPLV